MNNQYNMLIRQIITKKTNELKKMNKIVLEVSKNFNKIKVVRFLTDYYNVKVISINIINYRGKFKRIGKHKGKSRNWKKAIITLSKTSDLSIFGNNIK